MLCAQATWPARCFWAIQNSMIRPKLTNLTYGAGLAKRLFCGAICFGAVPSRMIDFMKRSPKFCEIMQDLFAGTQPYLELKNRLLRNVNTTLHEILMSFLFRKLILGETRVT